MGNIFRKLVSWVLIFSFSFTNSPILGATKAMAYSNLKALSSRESSTFGKMLGEMGNLKKPARDDGGAASRFMNIYLQNVIKGREKRDTVGRSPSIARMHEEKLDGTLLGHSDDRRTFVQEETIEKAKTVIKRTPSVNLNDSELQVLLKTAAADLMEGLAALEGMLDISFKDKGYLKGYLNELLSQAVGEEHKGAVERFNTLMHDRIEALLDSGEKEIHVCVGSDLKKLTLEDQIQEVTSQLNAYFKGISKEKLKDVKVYIYFEPSNLIGKIAEAGAGSDVAAEDDMVRDVHQAIYDWSEGVYGRDFTRKSIWIGYGASVDKNNAERLSLITSTKKGMEGFPLVQGALFASSGKTPEGFNGVAAKFNASAVKFSEFLGFKKPFICFFNSKDFKIQDIGKYVSTVKEAIDRKEFDPANVKLAIAASDMDVLLWRNSVDAIQSAALKGTDDGGLAADKIINPEEIYVIKSVGKGLIDYLDTLPSNIQLNIGAASGKKYIIDALSSFTKEELAKKGINITQRQVIGKPIAVNIDGDEQLRQYIKDEEAQQIVKDIFEDILKEKNKEKKTEMFNKALAAKYDNANVVNLLKSVEKALGQVKSAVPLFMLDASSLPVASNVRVTAFLAGFVPKAEVLEVEVGEIGLDKSSTLADVLQVLTGIRYEEKVVKDAEGVIKSSQLITKKKELMGKFVVKFSEVDKNDGSFVGGKGGNLGEMFRFVPEVSVPDGVAVTTTAFKKHIDQGLVTVKGKQITLRQFINQRLKELEATEGGYDNTEALAYAAEDIRKAIVAAEIPEDVKQAIIDGYNSLGQGPVAVRSSATAEDLPDASFAGQQDTYLNMEGEEEVVDAVRRNWASLFTDRAIVYRHENGIDHSTTMLSAIIQRMVFSKAAGTAFTVDVGTGFPVYKIDGAYGFGEGVVNGSLTPDTWILDRAFRFLRRDFGSKLVKYVPTEKKNVLREEGIEKIDTSYAERHNFCLTDEQVKMVARACEAIHKHYGMYMDIEWAFDKDGKLWIVQARPETVWNKWEQTNPDTVNIDNTIVPDDIAAKAETVLSGVTGARAAAGTVVKIDSSKQGPALGKELAKVEKGQLMVTTMTTPDMVPAMKRAAGFITDEGGPTCHAAIVARELKKPCVVGTGKATQVLEDGMEETVDANKGRVYSKLQKIIKLEDNIHVPSLPELKTKIGTIIASPFLAMSVAGISKYISYYGVSLMRKEFTDTMEILVHPLAGLAYDKYRAGRFKDEAEKKVIEEKVMNDKALVEQIGTTILGYKDYSDFYKQKLASAIALVAFTQTKGQRVKFRITDLKTNEYDGQIGGGKYEPNENNPMMGYRGAYRMLSKDYLEAFELELEAIAEARKLQKNIDVMFPVVRTKEELIAGAALMDKYGLFDGDDKTQLGIMVEVSANVILAEELFKTLADLSKQYGTKAFMSIGSNDLTQFTLSLGRDNKKMIPFFDETNPAVKRAVEIVVKIAKKYGIITGICGNRPTQDPPYSGFLVEVGIDSIGVVPEGYKKVVEVVAEQEKILEEKGYNPEIIGFAMPSTLAMANPEVVEAVEVDAARIIKEIGVHPLTLLKYEKGEIVDVVLKTQIEKILGGKSAKEFVAEKVYQSLMQKAANGAIVYSTDDLQKTVYDTFLGAEEYPAIAKEEFYNVDPSNGASILEKLIKDGILEEVNSNEVRLKRKADGFAVKDIPIPAELANDEDKASKFIIVSGKLRESFEAFDENPQIGFNGLVRVVDADYQEFLSWQLAGVKKAIDANAQVSIKLDIVRTLDEVSKALGLMKSAGLVQGQKGFKVGMEIDIMANTLLVDEFIKAGISFFSENKGRYLSYIFAEDYNSKYIQIPAEQKEEGWVNSQKVWTNAAVRNNIPMVKVEEDRVAPPSGLFVRPDFNVGPEQKAPSLVPAHLGYRTATQIPSKVREDGGAAWKTTIPMFEAVKGNMEGQVVYIRVDLNVLNKKGEFETLTRFDDVIDEAIRVLDAGGTPLFVTHVGKHKDGLSTRKIVDKFVELAKARGHDIPVKFLENSITKDGVRQGVKYEIEAAKANFLENVRLTEKEEKKDPEFAKALADLAGPIKPVDGILEPRIGGFAGFGSAGVDGASSKLVFDYMDEIYVAPSVVNEIDSITHIRENINMLIFGGSDKIADKAKLLDGILDNFKNGGNFVAGSASSVVFHKANGVEIKAANTIDEETVGVGRKLNQKAKARSINMLLPVDYRLADKNLAELGITEKDVPVLAEKLAGVNLYQLTLEQLGQDTYTDPKTGKVIDVKDLYIYDIGEQSEKNIEEAIKNMPKTGTVFWNGNTGLDFVEQSSAKIGELLDKYVPVENRLLAGGTTSELADRLNRNLVNKLKRSTGGSAALTAMQEGTTPVTNYMESVQYNINLAGRLKTTHYALNQFSGAENTVAEILRIDLFKEFINVAADSLNQATTKESPKAFILGPEFFKLGGVTEALKLLNKFSGAVKVGVYGDIAPGVKLLLEKDLGNNVVIGKTEQEVRLALIKEGVNPKDIRFAGSSEDIIDQATAQDLKDNDVKQVIADDMAPLVIAQLINDLFGRRVIREALASYHEKLAKEDVIKQATYDATKDAMLTKLDGALDFSEQLKPAKVVSDKIAESKEVIAKFIDRL